MFQWRSVSRVLRVTLHVATSCHWRPSSSVSAWATMWRPPLTSPATILRQSTTNARPCNHTCTKQAYVHYNYVIFFAVCCVSTSLYCMFTMQALAAFYWSDLYNELLPGDSFTVVSWLIPTETLQISVRKMPSWMSSWIENCPTCLQQSTHSVHGTLYCHP